MILSIYNIFYLIMIDFYLIMIDFYLIMIDFYLNIIFIIIYNDFIKFIFIKKNDYLFN